MNLCMTDEEIRRSYTEAKNRHYQVQILSELNATEPEIIIKKLKAMGVFSEEEERRDYKRYSRPARVMSRCETKAAKLYQDGHSDREIADALEISETTVSRWRKTKQLPPNHTYAKKIPAIKDLLSRGLTIQEVADIMHVCHHTVRQIRDSAV